MNITRKLENLFSESGQQKHHSQPGKISVAIESIRLKATILKSNIIIVAMSRASQRAPNKVD